MNKVNNVKQVDGANNANRIGSVNNILLQLFTSRVRMKVLNVFIANHESMYYVRQVTRLVGEEVNAVRRELERLREISLLGTEKRGNRLYYRVRTDFPFYYDLLRIVGKTTGFGQVVGENINALGKVKFAMLSAEFITGRQSGLNDIDFLIVGRVQLDALQNMVRNHEGQIGREINYTVMTEEEFDFRKRRGDAFIRDVLRQPQVVLVGDEVELNR